jgi:saccharopine dehydrogenase-like NADP-dependent oxidoreductase
MTNILILGGYGYTGRLLARYLLQESQVSLILAGRNQEKAQVLADELNAEYKGKRVQATFADAADTASLKAALRGVDLILVASPTTHYTAQVARAALEAGADYLDVQISAQKIITLRAIAGEIEAAGRCFITEAGFHPGLPAAMIRYAAAQLDRLESAVTAGYLNMGRSMPYNEAVDELVETFKEYQAQVFKDGSWTKPSSFEMRKFDFGSPIGLKNCYSMFFEELHALPEMYPSLQRVGFYISESHWLVDYVIYPLAMLGLKVLPARAMRSLGKFIWWGMRTLPRPPYLVALGMEANGQRNGKPAEVRAILSHPDGYILTAVPVVALLLQYLDGSARHPGLWMMGHLAEPVRLFKDMERMGVKVETTIG